MSEKIKYKLQKMQMNENYKEFDFNNKSLVVNCSFDFLQNKYEQPYIIFKNNDKISIWYIKVKTSNNYEYYIYIYNYTPNNINLENINKWYIYENNENNEYLDYKRLIKFIEYQYKNFNKKQEKQNNHIINDDMNKFINETKYTQIDTEKIKELSDDDLVCILFTRFKKSNNPLIKEILIIHRTLNGFVNDENKNQIKKNKTKYNNKITIYNNKR